MQVSYLRLIFLSAFCSLLSNHAEGSMLRAAGNGNVHANAAEHTVSRSHNPRALESYEKVAAAVISVAKEINGFSKEAFDKSKDLKKWCADTQVELSADLSGHEQAKKAMQTQLTAVEKTATDLQREIAHLTEQIDGHQEPKSAQITIDDKLRALLRAKKEELKDVQVEMDRLHAQIEHAGTSMSVGKQLQQSGRDECTAYEHVFTNAMHRLSIESNAAQQVLEYVYPSLLDKPVPAQIYSSNAKFFIEKVTPSPSAAVSFMETAVSRHTVSVEGVGSDDPLAFIKRKLIEIIAQMAGDQERDMDKAAYCNKAKTETQKKIDETETRRQQAIEEIQMYKNSVGGWRDGEKFMATLTEKMQKEQDELDGRFGVLVTATKSFVDHRKLLAEKIDQAIEELSIAVTYAPGDKEKIETAVKVLSIFAKSLRETQSSLGPVVGVFEKQYTELYESMSKAVNARKAEQSAFRFSFEQASRKLQRATEDKERLDRELTDMNVVANKLAEQCRAGGSTYEDRKARREDEITALREALSILSGQTI